MEVGSPPIEGRSEAAARLTRAPTGASNGLELQGTLLTKGARLPIMFVATDFGSKAYRQARACGAVVLLTKPFREEALISCLDQALSAHSA